jgi:hypothetical protein
MARLAKWVLSQRKRKYAPTSLRSSTQLFYVALVVAGRAKVWAEIKEVQQTKGA